jgi:hypothetical protein
MVKKELEANASMSALLQSWRVKKHSLAAIIGFEQESVLPRVQPSAPHPPSRTTASVMAAVDSHHTETINVRMLGNIDISSSSKHPVHDAQKHGLTSHL